ncbi:MAG: hypothetical protein H7246_08630, partial [Phycisphaerae bacterium]|nr:hypothetical protein [Saprospiraceae bacterium]
MENIDIQQIESYLQGKMTLEEQRAFEVALAADPELRRRHEELRQMAKGIRQVARADIRQRVETLRDKIKQEESAPHPEPHSANLGKSAAFLVIGLFLGLGLGWLLFNKPAITPPPPDTQNTGQAP